METALYIAALLILLLGSMYVSAAESAFFSLSSMRVKAYRSSSDPRKRLIADLVLKPRDLLVTVFMLNTMTNILLQNVASSMFGIDAHWILKVGFPLFVLLFFGEIFPKHYGLQNSINYSYRVAPSINALQNLMKPIRKWTIAVTYPISRILFFFLRKEKSISREELEHVLKSSEAHGILHPDEAELVWGYLDIQDMLVKELMRPRGDMFCYNIREPLSKLIYLFSEKKYSRIPVYDDVLDNLIGIISAKQFFLYGKELSKPEQLKEWLAKPLYVPENTPAKTLLKRFDSQNKTMAIVVDEYGSISGLITREDILEIVIGKSGVTQDAEQLYSQAGENEIIASGKLELSEFNDLFGTDLESPENMVTLGGWLIEQLGEIPKMGTTYKTNDFLFKILSAEPTRIRRIYVRYFGAGKSNQKKGK